MPYCLIELTVITSTVQKLEVLFVRGIELLENFKILIVCRLERGVRLEGLFDGNIVFYTSEILDNSKSYSDYCRRTDCADILRSVNYLDRSAGYIGKYLSRYVGERTAADKAYRI